MNHTNHRKILRDYLLERFGKWVHRDELNSICPSLNQSARRSEIRSIANKMGRDLDFRREGKNQEDTWYRLVEKEKSERLLNTGEVDYQSLQREYHSAF